MIVGSNPTGSTKTLYASIAQLVEREAYTFCMPQIRARLGVRIPLLVPISIDLWCNGNTGDFDSLILGSSPGGSARQFRVVDKAGTVLRPLQCTPRGLYK